MSKRKLTEELVNEIITLRKTTNLLIVEIAKVVNLSRGSVCRVLAANGLSKTLIIPLHKKRKRRPSQEAGLRVHYNSYKHDAKIKHREFSISFNEFCCLVSNNCNYCGESPSYKCATVGVKFLANGVDRIDNSAGYTLSNCVSCCETCNKAKRHLTLEVFEQWLNRIVLFRTGVSKNEFSISVSEVPTT